MERDIGRLRQLGKGAQSSLQKACLYLFSFSYSLGMNSIHGNELGRRLKICIRSPLPPKMAYGFLGIVRALLVLYGVHVVEKASVPVKPYSFPTISPNKFLY